jgi:hypothetical protein
MRAFVAGLVLAVTAGIAPAAESLPAEVAQLDEALAARIAALEGGAAPSATQELAKLESARIKLGLYEGENDVADFKALAAAGRALYASETDDATVLAEAAQVLEAICDLATSLEGLAEDAKAELLKPANAALVEAILTRARTLFGDGKDLVATDPVKAQALVGRARKLFAKALAKALKLHTAEIGVSPKGISSLSGRYAVWLLNASDRAYDVTRIRLFVQVTADGTPIGSYDGDSATELFPDLFSTPFSNRLYPAYMGSPTYFDVTSILFQLVPLDTTAPRVFGRIEVTLRGFAPFTVLVDVAPD